ncbi:putative FAD-linked oxidoreductase [Colletotrichum trifolii]|uniref:Putative FAD-linked oxidoreductase n=1 Tax=Colletotrichum trifolii TaxID=5466 RepID=A0A4V3HTF7_COLTR|nr:putative FAD-linked oxidoreductase [Colletotrichum trifolii]
MASSVCQYAALAVLVISGLASATPLAGLRQANEAGGRGCSALARAGLSEQLSFPAEAEYNGTIESYYDGGVQDVSPRCVFKPETTQQVSDALRTLSLEGGSCWSVAIRSGGHSVFPNNNAQNGVTIDLGRLNSVIYAEGPDSRKGHGTASIGAGARWGNVYAVLEKEGVMVTGAREGHVGVGGFLLGGGFAWHSGQHGMACDNVVSYEVVLANGTVVTATATTHPDLWQSLKGGLNNLGLVTRFDLGAFPSQDAYGGIVAYSYTQAQPLLQKFTSMVRRNKKDPAENGFLSFVWSPAAGRSATFVLANVDGIENSTSFSGLGDLEPLIDTRSKTSISGLVRSLQGSLGLYNVWFTLTFHASMSMGLKVLEVFESVTNDLDGTLGNSDQVIFLLTPLPTNYVNRGPNVLGLNDGGLSEDCMVLQAEALLSSPEHKALLADKLSEAVEQTINSYAVVTNQLLRWKYLNYANPTQDVWSTIGDDKLLLGHTAETFDPTGFFQHRVNGGFKVSDSSDL